MSENVIEKEKFRNTKEQDWNIPFLSPSEIKLRATIPTPNILGNRVVGWNINDLIQTKDDTLKKEIENKIDRIDEKKENMKRYSNADEYLNHVDRIIEE